MKPQSGHDVTQVFVLGLKMSVTNSAKAQLGAIDVAAGPLLSPDDTPSCYWNGSHFK